MTAHTAAFLTLYKDLYLTNVKTCKYWHFLWGRVLIICWNWTFHFLTHLIFCRWGFRHYSLMADTPTPRASVLRYLQPRVGVSKSEYLSSAYLPKFSKYSNICKIICVWQARCIKNFHFRENNIDTQFCPTLKLFRTGITKLGDDQNKNFLFKI